MSDKKEAPQTQIVNPGPSKEVWDGALVRSGLSPEIIEEYNVTDTPQPAWLSEIQKLPHSPEITAAIAEAEAAAGCKLEAITDKKIIGLMLAAVADQADKDDAENGDKSEPAGTD